MLSNFMISPPSRFLSKPAAPPGNYGTSILRSAAPHPAQNKTTINRPLLLGFFFFFSSSTY